MSYTVLLQPLLGAEYLKNIKKFCFELKVTFFVKFTMIQHKYKILLSWKGGSLLQTVCLEIPDIFIYHTDVKIASADLRQ